MQLKKWSRNDDYEIAEKKPENFSKGLEVVPQSTCLVLNQTKLWSQTLSGFSVEVNFIPVYKFIKSCSKYIIYNRMYDIHRIYNVNYAKHGAIWFEISGVIWNYNTKLKYYTLHKFPKVLFIQIQDFWWKKNISKIQYQADL